MKVCVFGLGHLGSVTAACLAANGHEVVGLDPDSVVVERLSAGKPPVLEPGLPELLAEFHPAFTTDTAAAIAGADAIWLTDDTPVKDDDTADVEWVLRRATSVLASAAPATLVVVSSQLPAGTVGSLESAHAQLRFVCIPENLRLGRAVETFRRPERTVVGIRDETVREDVVRLLTPNAQRLTWMSVESAELTKHALNAFLATSVAFANELAGICEITGANVREVEAGLRSDGRIGPHAYLAAGPPFSGGTLAREVEYLRAFGRNGQRSTAVLDGVVAANDKHTGWVRQRLGEADVRVAAVWGIAYKPGTDSVRRSEAVALCRWLIDRGTRVRVHDPAVRPLPASLAGLVFEAADPLEAAQGADALVVAVAWPEYASVPAAAVASAMTRPFVLDPAGTTAATLGRHPDVRYSAVGVTS